MPSESAVHSHSKLYFFLQRCSLPISAKSAIFHNIREKDVELRVFLFCSNVHMRDLMHIFSPCQHQHV